VSKAKEFEAAANELADAYVKVITLAVEQPQPTNKEDALATLRAYGLAVYLCQAPPDMFSATLALAERFGATSQEKFTALDAPRALVEKLAALNARLGRHDN
jgi:benzoyl-CoA reductase/2-hydroxyglutaryl-CoA dehydratase subunit BcrC/BadD/HgdB